MCMCMCACNFGFPSTSLLNNKNIFRCFVGYSVDGGIKKQILEQEDQNSYSFANSLDQFRFKNGQRRGVEKLHEESLDIFKFSNRSKEVQT